MAAIVTVLLVVTLSLLVTRVATLALTLTGLSAEAARFQARSALTGAGFTTSESEAVVGHPVRRRVIMVLMLTGSAGIVTVIATLAASFANREGIANDLLKFAMLAVGMVMIVWVSRTRAFDRIVNPIIRRLLLRYTNIDARDYAALLRVHGDYAVGELSITEGDYLAGRTLAELRLSDEGVLVLGVQRDSDTYLGAPRADVTVRAGDVLIVYGPGERIADLDDRPSGPAGDEARDRAVADQRVRELRDRAIDRAREEPTDDGRRRRRRRFRRRPKDAARPRSATRAAGRKRGDGAAAPYPAASDPAGPQNQAAPATDEASEPAGPATDEASDPAGPATDEASGPAGPTSPAATSGDGRSASEDPVTSPDDR